MKVYHTKEWALNSDLHFVDSAKINPHWAGGYKPLMANYKLVAEIDFDDKDAVYNMTNSFDHPWTDNDVVEGIHVFVDKARSTSVGDLLEDADGQLWLVAGFGFEKVEWHNGPFKVYDNGRECGTYLVHATTKEEKMIERYQGLVNEFAEECADELLEVLVKAAKKNLLKRGFAF